MTSVNVMKDVVPLNQQSQNRSCNVQFVFVFSDSIIILTKIMSVAATEWCRK